ncbi:MAG TPA: SDR family NAD(P)-dependent oxidoreductase, partial [Kofleriaceae bacterium]
DIDELIAKHEPLAEPVPRAPADPAQLTYTSGSTGASKGTIYTHGGMDAFLTHVARQIVEAGDPELVSLVMLPVTAFGGFLLRSRFTARQKLVALTRFDPKEAHEAITGHGVTQLSLVPSLAEGLLSIADSVVPPTTVKEIRIAGAHTSPELARGIERHFGARLINTYGMTEAGGGITSDDLGDKVGSVGRASPGVEIKIVDGEGRVVATGHEGEIFVRTPWQASGYWGQTPDAAVFQPDGWLRTGDRGRLDVDGALYLSGRSKDIIIQGGHNVVPVEVHDVVRSVPGVAECAIVGVPDPFLGEMVVAWIVRLPDATVTEQDVLAQCRKVLDPRKWPGRVCFTDALPLSPNGKVKLDELRQRTVVSFESDPALVKQLRGLPPDRRGAVMRAAITRELATILGREPADPSATFGSAGVSSLGAVQLAGALSRLLGRAVPVTLLFRHSTVDALARALLEGETTRRRATRRASDEDPIAIVAAACRLPGGVTTPEQFWDLLQSGRDTVREAPEGRWQTDGLYDPERPKPGKTYVRTASFLDGADEFDAAFFGMTSEAQEIDPQHRLLLETSWEALERAGYDPRAVPGLVGMMVGISSSSYPPRNPLGVHRGMALGRVCHFLNLRGPSASIDTTCSSSLVALHDAVRALRLGECDTALVGGVSMIWSLEPVVGLCQLELLAADGRSKAFDASGDGFGQGEGCIVLVLERLSEARARGNRVLAIVRGSAINHDGHSSSLTAPNPEAQQEVIQTALAAADLEPDAVQYIEAHGTGTVLGDPIEVEALTATFGARRIPLAIGSVKSNIGHLEAAAGLAGALKVVLAMQHRRVPPSLHFNSPNPHIPWDSISIRVQHELGPWPAPDAPLIAGVSSFGLSGTNAHVIFEEAPRDQSATTKSTELLALPISARTPAALSHSAERFADALDTAARSDIAYTAACRRHHFPHRLVVLGGSATEWATRLRAYARGEQTSGVIVGRTARQRELRSVFVFNGQGSQWWGMGRELLAKEPVFASAFDRCAAAIEAHVSWRLRDELGRDEATTRLAETEIAQPAIFAVQVALTALWRAWGVEPAAVVGHSIGEVAAAHVAGALTLEAAARLVTTRGRLMQTATGLGKMAWATMEVDAAEKMVAEIPGLELAASNGPRSITFSGPAPAIEHAVRTLNERGVECKELRVNYAFHSAILEEHARALAVELRDLPWREPVIPMISTLTGARVAQLDAAYWGAEIRGRVRFFEAIRTLLADGYSHFIEVGSHPVVTAPIEHAIEESGQEAFVVASLRRNHSDRLAMLEAISALHTTGYPIDWTRQSPDGRIVDLPTYPWEHQRYRIEDDLVTRVPRAADPLDRLFHRIAWKERTSTAPPIRDARYLIVADERGVGEALRSALEKSGSPVVLATEPLDLSSTPTRIVYLKGLDTSSETLERDVQRECISLLQLAQAIVRRGWDKAPRLFVVTRGAQAARESTPGFAQSALWGMGAGLVHELPELDTTLIDLDPTDTDVTRLHDELARADREDRIALRGGARLVPRLVRAQAPASSWVADPERTYLVTGGLGGLGLVVVRRLVALGARHIAIVGRSAPSPETQRILDELPAKVLVARADVANAEQLAAAFEQVRSTMPALAGVIHAAGVSDSGVITNLDAERVRNVMAPKVLGAWNLHRLTQDLSLDQFVMFGSVAG